MNFLLMPLFGVMDRIFGSDVKHGRRWAALGIVLSTLIAGLGAVIVAALWFGYRSIGMFGGSAAPRKGQYHNSVLRHSIGILPFVATAAILGISLVSAVQAGAAYAAVASALAIWYGMYRDAREAAGKDIGKANEYLEVIRGIAFGAASAWFLTNG